MKRKGLRRYPATWSKPMNIVRVETLRRLIPALAVGSVLAFSLFAASPSLASSTNNCGVKGYGYHDHGKVCPNRPFPGHGTGVLRILASGLVTSGSTVDITAQTKGKVRTQVNVTATNGSKHSKASTAIVRGHGHGRGLALGRST